MISAHHLWSMHKQKESSADTEKLLDMEKNLKKKEYKICELLLIGCMWLLVLLCLGFFILYISSNSKNENTAQISMSKTQPMTEASTAFIDFDILINKIDNILENVNLIRESLMWDKKNETSVGNVTQANDISTHSNFLKKLIKVSLNSDKQSHSTKKVDEHKQPQTKLRTLEDFKNISDLDFTTTTSNLENSVEYKNDINPTSSFQEETLPVHFPRTFLNKLLSYEKHAMDDLLSDVGDNHNYDSNDSDDDYVSDEHNTFLSARFHQNFPHKEFIPYTKYATGNLLKDDKDRYYDDSNDSDDDYVSNSVTFNKQNIVLSPRYQWYSFPFSSLKKFTSDEKYAREHKNSYDDSNEDDSASDEHEKFSPEHFHQNFPHKELISHEKHAIDDLSRDNKDSSYDDSNYSEDDSASKEHEKFSHERFHRDFPDIELFPSRYVSDDLLRGHRDSSYDDSNNSEDDSASDEREKFSHGRFHRDFPDIELLPSRYALDDLLRGDGDSSYDDSNNSEDDSASDEREKFSHGRFHRDFPDIELLSSRYALDDLLRGDGDSSYDDSNNFDDDSASDEREKFSSEHFHQNFPHKELISHEKHAIDDLSRDNKDSSYDDSNDSEDDSASKEHEKFSHERFHRDFPDIELLSSRYAPDDLLRGDGDSSYDDSNDSENDFASEEHEKFSHERFHRDFSGEELISDEKYAIDDSLRDDGDQYDDFNDYDDDNIDIYVSDEHEKSSDAIQQLSHSGEELISDEKYAIDDSLRDDGDQYNDFNDYDDANIDIYVSDEHEKSSDAI